MVSLSLLAAIAAAAAKSSLLDREINSLTADEITELVKLLQSDWQSSLEARIDVGWDSNLLLSNIVKDESGFSRATVEGMLWRPAREGQPVELVGFLSASYRKIFSSGNLPNDAEALAQCEARWRPVPPLRLSLSAQGYYLDTVLDLSTESERFATPLRNAGFNGGTMARWERGTHWWMEATGAINHSNFHQLPENYQERRLGIHMGWQTGDRKLKLSVGALQRDRVYSERNLTTASGRSIAGTRLRYRAPELAAHVERIVDWHGAWKLSGSWSAMRNDDNGGDYFNYRLAKLLAAVEWTLDPWEIEFSFGTGRYRWDVQVAGIGLDPPKRRRLEETFTLQLKRHLNEHWFLLLDAERENVSSNDPSMGYNLTMVSAGIGWRL